MLLEREPEAVADVVAADDKEALALDGAAVAPASTASKTIEGNNSSGPRISITLKEYFLDKISTHNDKGEMCKHTRLKKSF